MYGVLKSIGVHDLQGMTDDPQNDLGALGGFGIGSQSGYFGLRARGNNQVLLTRLVLGKPQPIELAQLAGFDPLKCF
jgi:hypothetical protein